MKKQAAIIATITALIGGSLIAFGIHNRKKGLQGLGSISYDKTRQHITDTERKAISYLLDNGLSEGGTKTKYYYLTGKHPDYTVKICSKYTATYGDISRWHCRSFDIKVS